MVEQLASNAMGKEELFRQNDINRMSFASIWYEFLHVMLCVTVRWAALLQWSDLGLDKSIGHYRKKGIICEPINFSRNCAIGKKNWQII